MVRRSGYSRRRGRDEQTHRTGTARRIAAAIVTA